MTIIGLKELSQNAGKIAERVAKGERFTVVKRSKPVFEISPPTEVSDLGLTQKWVDNYIENNKPLLESLSKK
jgi:prevent-host-death family protein